MVGERAVLGRGRCEDSLTDVLHIAYAASATCTATSVAGRYIHLRRTRTIRWDAFLYTCPRLYISGMRTAIADDPLGRNVLDKLVYTGVLPDGTDGNANRVVEM